MLKSRVCEGPCHPGASIILRGRCLSATSKYYRSTIPERMISTVHHPSTILRGRCLEDDTHCAPSKYYHQSTMLNRMTSTVHHPGTILRGRCLRGCYPLCKIQALYKPHCAPCKYYASTMPKKMISTVFQPSTNLKRTMLIMMISTLHPPNIILRGQCLGGWFSLCNIQVLSKHDP